jgi:hypothetical protein
MSEVEVDLLYINRVRMKACYNIAGDIGVLESLFVIIAKNGELMFL